MNMGTTQRLKAARETDNGFYFTDGEAEILLPRSELPPDWKVGVEAELFLYRDSEDRPTATRRRPAAEVGQAAMMTVVAVSPIGAFVSWGLLKDLLVPHGEQATPLREGQAALVMVQVDDATDRLFGTTKIGPRLSRDLTGFQEGGKVACQVWKLHDLGWLLLVEHRWQGLVYRDEVPGNLKPGDVLQAWIVQLREDGKLDLRLKPPGFHQANPGAEEALLAALAKAGGRLPVGDKSDPGEIQAMLGMSKKAFKTACGTLHKKGLVRLEPNAVISAKAASSSS